MQPPSFNDVTSAAQNAAGQANDAAHDAGNAAANTAQDLTGNAQDAATQGGEAAHDPKGAADHARATGQHILDAGMGDAKAIANQLRGAPAAVRDAVLGLAHQRYGNGFVQQVLDLVHQVGSVVDAKLGAAKDAIRGKQNQLRGLGTRLGASGKAIADVIATIASAEIDNIRDIVAAEAVHAAVTEMVQVAIAVLGPIAETPQLVGLIRKVADVVQGVLTIGGSIAIYKLTSDVLALKHEVQRLEGELHRVDGKSRAIVTELQHARTKESDEQERVKDDDRKKQSVHDNVDKAADGYASILKSLS